MANSVDFDQTAFRSSLILVCTVCICHFVNNFGVQNFRTFTVLWNGYTLEGNNSDKETFTSLFLGMERGALLLGAGS